MNKDFLIRAIQLAEQNVEDGNGGPFGAVIVKDGRIIAEGVNTVTSSNDPTAHAEVNAIRNACKKLGTFNLSDCEIYASCEPCPMCLSAVYWARISRIYYAADRHDAAQVGFDDSLIYKEIPLDEKERQIPSCQCLEELGHKPFELWQEKENKIQY